MKEELQLEGTKKKELMIYDSQSQENKLSYSYLPITQTRFLGYRFVFVIQNEVGNVHNSCLDVEYWHKLLK